METSIRTGGSALVHSPTVSKRGENYSNKFTTFEIVVTDVVYNTNSVNYSKYGNIIGVIEGYDLETYINVPKEKRGDPIVAYPHSSNNLYSPLINETVIVESASSYEAQSDETKYIPKWYWTRIVSKFSSAEHNSIANPNIEEKGTKLLQHNPGDLTLQGRFANSIRIGSSQVSSNSPWKGINSSPLMIMSNGHYSYNNLNSYDSIYEDLNRSGTVIGMFSGQDIGFISPCLNFGTYKENISNPSNVVLSSSPTASVTSSISQSDAVNKVTDSTPSSYQIVNSSAPINDDSDEIKYIPDSESVSGFQQILEDPYAGDIPHYDDPNFRKKIELGINYSNYPDKNQNIISFLKGNPYFLTYLIHNQGLGGTKAIIYYASINQQTIPKNNGFTSQDVMFHIQKNVGSHYKNIAKEQTVTPSGFLRYYSYIYTNKFNIYANKTNTPIETLIQNLTIDEKEIWRQFIRTVIGIESDFNPSLIDIVTNKKGEAKQNQYRGLFQLNLKDDLSKYYPNASENDLLDPVKNATAGISILKKYYSQAINIINTL